MNESMKKRILALALVATSACSFAACGDKTYYEATVVYYVNPVKEEDSHTCAYDYGIFVMGNLMELLNSQVFSEILTSAMPSCPKKQDADGGWSAAYKAYFKSVDTAVEFSSENNFVTVDVSVGDGKGEKFANELLEAVKMEVPQYVIDNIMLPDGYLETICEKVSTLDEITKVKK